MKLRNMLPVAGAPLLAASIFLAAGILLAASVPGLAGPCTHAIDRMQARVDALLAARAAAGPSATEGTSATMHRQPTPESIAAAEAKLGDISTETLDAIATGMTRAREADRAGDAEACKAALAEVGRALGAPAD
ncbi:hypothetical protein [Blastochloris tepida]|uniref:Uncharacterized protein n=1 Tax=Blastochloris tepida TaxID=2233851 RepID=A0A348G017_9HYPH|nr:hypothetical protein [Blastochloris tepida]BBF92900.1 hypothetical protein BLTE_15850 [Blastochloris tepida]